MLFLTGPFEIECRKLTLPGGEAAKHYLVLSGLVRATVDLRVARVGKAAEVGGQGQFGATGATSEIFNLY